jgi:hypothetical protein
MSARARSMGVTLHRLAAGIMRATRLRRPAGTDVVADLPHARRRPRVCSASLSMLLTLLSAVAVGAQPVKLAAPDLSGVNVEPAAIAFYSERFALQLRAAGLSVSTGRDIAAVIGLERTRELAGCTDDAQSCFTELANALGAEGVVIGSIGRFGDAFQVDFKVVRSSDAKPLAVTSARVRGEAELLDALGRLARELAVTLGAAPRSRLARPAVLVPAALALVSGVVAGVCLGLGRAQWAALETAPAAGMAEISGATAASYRQSGPVLFAAGYAGVGLAVAAAVVALVALLTFDGT